MRQKRDTGDFAAGDLPDGQFEHSTVQTIAQKYFAFAVGQITARSLPVPRPHEGRFAIVTDVGCGVRWTLVARKTNA
jgi:hypothetical protein